MTTVFHLPLGSHAAKMINTNDLVSDVAKELQILRSPEFDDDDEHSGKGARREDGDSSSETDTSVASAELKSDGSFSSDGSTSGDESMLPALSADSSWLSTATADDTHDSKPAADSTTEAEGFVRPAWAKPGVGNQAYLATRVSPTELGLPVKYLDLHYPLAWHRPVRLERSMWAQRAERDAIKWILDLDMLPPAKAERLGVGEYGGLSLPLGNYQQTLYFCKFLVVFLLWDDVVEDGTDAPGEIEAIRAVLAGSRQPLPEHLHGNKWIRAWQDVADDMRAMGASDAAMKRFSKAFTFWLDWTIRQREVHDRALYEEVGFEHLGLCRMGSSGAIVSASLIEMSMGIELPAAVTDHPNFDLLIDQIHIVAGFVNELFSLGKDIKNADPQGRWGNLIWCHRFLENQKTGAQGPVMESVEYVKRLHDEALAKVDAMYDDLASWVAAGDIDIVQNYITLLRYYIHGLGVWQATANRYNSDFAVDVKANVVFRTRQDPPLNQPFA